MKERFDINIQFDVSLTIDEIWPDGDAPENPTVDDVKEVILNQYGMSLPKEKIPGLSNAFDHLMDGILCKLIADWGFEEDGH